MLTVAFFGETSMMRPDGFTTGTAVPVPASGAVTVPAAVVTVSVALRPPSAVGVKRIRIPQLEFGPSDAPQLLVCANSDACAPAMVITMLLSGAVPALASVII